jgi:glycerol uptake facilitator-like aquaporin
MVVSIPGDGREGGRMHRRAAIAEFVGTAVLLFVEVVLVRWLYGPASPLTDRVHDATARAAVVAVLTGALITILLVSPLGQSSGGHLNPAVTVATWLLRGVPGPDAVLYVLAQLAGSVVGVGLARGLLGAAAVAPSVRLALVAPARGWSTGGVVTGEALSFYGLMAVAVSFLTHERLRRWTPAATGAVVASLVLVGARSSGGSFNPARAFGPAVAMGEWHLLWVYLLLPVVGASALVATVRLGFRVPALPCGLCGQPAWHLATAVGRWRRRTSEAHDGSRADLRRVNPRPTRRKR